MTTQQTLESLRARYNQTLSEMDAHRHPSDNDQYMLDRETSARELLAQIRELEAQADQWDEQIAADAQSGALEAAFCRIARAYRIRISRDGIHAGDGRYRDGQIYDCPAVLPEGVYEAIEQAIARMAHPMSGILDMDGHRWSWEISEL